MPKRGCMPRGVQEHILGKGRAEKEERRKKRGKRREEKEKRKQRTRKGTGKKRKKKRGNRGEKKKRKQKRGKRREDNEERGREEKCAMLHTACLYTHKTHQILSVKNLIRDYIFSS